MGNKQQKKQKNDLRFMQSKTEVFALVKDEQNKIHVCMGGYNASTKTFDTFQQAEEYIASKPWELLINVCAIIITKNNEKEIQKNAEGNK